MFTDPDGMEAKGFEYSNGYSTQDSRNETGAVSHEGAFMTTAGDSQASNTGEGSGDDKPKVKKENSSKNTDNQDPKKPSQTITPNPYSCCRIRHNAKPGTFWYKVESFFAIQGLMMMPATAIEEAGGNIVYQSIEGGVTNYVGITNNLARRSAEHWLQVPYWA